MTKNTFAAWSAALALLVGPALAIADQPEGKGNKPDSTTPAQTTPVEPGASSKAKGNAYGKYCKDASKKKAAGQKKSAFAECVTAMAKLKSGKSKSAKAACKGLSKKKAWGQKKSSYAACISAAAKLKGDADEPAATTPSPSPSPEASPTPSPAASPTPAP